MACACRRRTDTLRGHILAVALMLPIIHALCMSGTLSQGLLGLMRPLHKHSVKTTKLHVNPTAPNACTYLLAQAWTHVMGRGYVWGRSCT